jgi:hypothetical protein
VVLGSLLPLGASGVGGGASPVLETLTMGEKARIHTIKREMLRHNRFVLLSMLLFLLGIELVECMTLAKHVVQVFFEWSPPYMVWETFLVFFITSDKDFFGP